MRGKLRFQASRSYVLTLIWIQGSSPTYFQLMQAALLLWHLGEREHARMYVSQLLDLQPHSVPALTLLGWIELHEAEAEAEGGDGTEAGAKVARAGSAFNEALAACAELWPPPPVRYSRPRPI